jgi:predicted kinase
LSLGTVYILCGLPFSGKSTFARALVERRKAILISLDTINDARGLSNGGDNTISQEEWEQTHNIALHQLAEAIQSKSDVVIDDTNCFWFLRENYRRVAESNGYQAIVVPVQTSMDEIDRRIALNEISHERHHVTREVLSRLVDTFEWPQGGEVCALPSTLLN